MREAVEQKQGIAWGQDRAHTKQDAGPGKRLQAKIGLLRQTRVSASAEMKILRARKAVGLSTRRNIFPSGVLKAK